MIIHDTPLLSLGWSAQYDETVEWQNSPRIAKIFTYTRRVKCFACLMPTKAKKHSKSKKVKNNSDVWPCKVLFRMPHPGDLTRSHIAEELLRLEPNILVQPYGFHENILPKALSKIFSGDFKTGRWISASLLLPWRRRTRVSDMGITQENFDTAMQLALADSSTPGFLPESVLEKGSLLARRYRVQTIEHVGSLYGELVPISHHSTENEENDLSASNSSRKPAARKFSVQFPGGVNIPDHVLYDCQEIFPSQQNSNHYSVQVKVGENDLFLGDYPSKSRAAEALRMCLGTNEDVQVKSDAVSQSIRDIHELSPETAISVWKNSSGKASNFCPKEWARAYIDKSSKDPSKWGDPLERAFS